MVRPIWLRPRTWYFGITRLLSLDRRQSRRLQSALGTRSLWLQLSQSQRAGALLLALGIHKKPLLIEDTVIRLGDGVEYLIPSRSARTLSGDTIVYLYRVYDGQKVPALTATIRRAIQHGGIFDQYDP